jgi:hypothetical protein
MSMGVPGYQAALLGVSLGCDMACALRAMFLEAPPVFGVNGEAGAMNGSAVITRG